MLQGLPAYSLLDTYATIMGPGGTVQVANGSGLAEEGITIEPIEDNVATQYGADGSWAHSLNPVKAYRVTCRLLKTSPTNALLDAMYALQKTSSLLTGQNFFHLNNVSSQDVFTGVGGAFGKHPANSYAKVAGMLDWEFIMGSGDWKLGAGVGVGV